MNPLQAFRRERMYMKALGLKYLLSRRSVEPGLVRARTNFGELFYRPADSDLMTLWQTLGAREYDLSRFAQYATVRAAYEGALASGRTPLIIDAGANIGGASVWFSTEFPRARVIAVEPDPANARLCRLNTQGRNVEVVEAAIGATPGTVSLVAGEASWAVRTVPGGGVPMITMAELLARAPGSEFLIAKIDIEGFEDELFAGDTAWVGLVTALIIEPHDWMLPGKGTSRSFRQAIGPEFEMLLSGENLVFVRAAALGGSHS